MFLIKIQKFLIVLYIEIHCFKWEGFYLYAGINSTFSDLLKIFIEFDIISQNISNI